MAIVITPRRDRGYGDLHSAQEANACIRLRFAPSQNDRHGLISRHLGVRVTAHRFEEEALFCTGDVVERAFNVITLDQNSTIEDVYRAARRSIFATFRVRAVAFPHGTKPGEAFGDIRIELNEGMLPVHPETWTAIRNAVVEDDEQAHLECWFTVVPSAVGQTEPEKRTKMAPPRVAITNSHRRRTVPEVQPMLSQRMNSGLGAWWRRTRTGSV